MKDELKVSNWTIARFWLVLLGIIATLAMIYWARTGILLILTGIFLAIVIHPLVQKIINKFKVSRLAGTSLAYVAIVLVVTIVGLLVIPSLIEQMADFTKALPNKINELSNNITNSNGIFSNAYIKSAAEQGLVALRNNMSNLASNFAGTIFNGFGSVAQFLMSSLIVLTLAFLILMDADNLQKSFWTLIPNGEFKNKAKNIAKESYSVITGFVNGQLLVAFVAGVSAGLAAFVLSLIFKDVPANSFAPVALAISLFDLIPMIGATIGSVLAALIISLANPIAGLVFILFTVVYQQIENNFIIPKIQGKTVNLSMLTVIVAETVAIYLFGVIGGIIAIPFAGIVKVIANEFGSESKSELFRSLVRTKRKSTKN